MLDYLVNPSAAITKRINLLNDVNAYSESLEIKLCEMKTLRKYFSIVDNMTYENALFHGYNSLENYVKVFSEYGVNRTNVSYAKCLDLLLSKKEGDDLYKRGITKTAEIFEDKGYSASKTIRASLLLCSGYKNEKEVNEKIGHSVECFKAVNGYENINDFAYQKNDKWVFRDGKLFPDYYNLRILALSDEWKNEETLISITKSINNLAKLQPIPSIYVKVKGQLVAPGSYLMHDFNSYFSEIDDNAKAEWLNRNEYFARMGLFNKDNCLVKVKKSINDPIELIKNMLSVKNNAAFTKWGAYSGVALEDNWTKDERKINDLAFRIGLIKYYSNEYFA